ncbi:polypeptide N-acetylgalactosaminyltransferase [Aureococcus anophagefferens]|nr:polypeptide N-acetylgalactosaminyltransferase [Aureococcus anophagefferens]
MRRGAASPTTIPSSIDDAPERRKRWRRESPVAVALVWLGIISILLLGISTRQRRVGVRRRVHGVRKFVVKEEAMLEQGLRHFVEEPFPFDDDDDDDDDRPSVRGEALAPEPLGNPSTWGTRGTPDSDHLHGRLIGRDADGSQHLPVEPYVSAKDETAAQKAEAHAHTCFNKRRSAALPLDRAVKDYRDARCKAKDYGALPAASVIMVFYDEPSFLLTGKGQLIFGDTLGTVDEKCVVVKEGAITMSEEKCSRGEWPEWTYTPDRTLQHRSGMCLLALASTVASLGDCDAGLDARTWYIDV